MSSCLALKTRLRASRKMAAGNMLLQTVSISLLLGVTAIIFSRFNAIQPDPYMDEIFHVPQAQNYCIGNFSHWDNKITTLPGLYIVSYICRRFLAYLPFILGEDQHCSTVFLRFENVLFMLLNFWLLYELSFMIHIEKIKSAIVAKYQKDDGQRKKKEAVKISKQMVEENIEAEVSIDVNSFANAFVLSLFPVLYFFAFLYYTDQGSTAMVLLTYWFSLQESHINAALTGAVAVCFRQTNIVWVAFIGGNSLLREIEDELPDFSNGLKHFIEDLYGLVKEKVSTIVLKAVPYALIGVAFCIFIVKNNGIVVGDRSSHQACLNIPQIFYFTGFTMACSFPLFFSAPAFQTIFTKLKELMENKTKLILTILCICLAAFAIARFTYVHEYLLADNRHYTFYLWRKIFQKHWFVKYLCIPCYLYSGHLIYHYLSAKNSDYFILLLLLCTAMVTVPQKLLEFRYFIIPYLLVRLHIPIPSFRSLAVELALYGLVNGVTFFLFLYKPFYWENEAGVQRFMW